MFKKLLNFLQFWKKNNSTGFVKPDSIPNPPTGPLTKLSLDQQSDLEELHNSINHIYKVWDFKTCRDSFPRVKELVDKLKEQRVGFTEEWMSSINGYYDMMGAIAGSINSGNFNESKFVEGLKIEIPFPTFTPKEVINYPKFLKDQRDIDKKFSELKSKPTSLYISDTVGFDFKVPEKSEEELNSNSTETSKLINTILDEFKQEILEKRDTAKSQYSALIDIISSEVEKRSNLKLLKSRLNYIIYEKFHTMLKEYDDEVISKVIEDNSDIVDKIKLDKFELYDQLKNKVEAVSETISDENHILTLLENKLGDFDFSQKRWEIEDRRMQKELTDSIKEESLLLDELEKSESEFDDISIVRKLAELVVANNPPNSKPTTLSEEDKELIKGLVENTTSKPKERWPSKREQEDLTKFLKDLDEQNSPTPPLDKSPPS